MRTLMLALFVSSVSLAGCAGALPEPVYSNQVDAYFPAPAAGAGDADTKDTRTAAEACAARLNAHRTKAKIGGILQGLFSGVGSIAGGTGGVLAAVLDDDGVRTAMGVLGAAGAGVTLIGNLVIGLALNPVKELRLHSDAAKSWNVAVELKYGNGTPTAIREALGRCARDEGPPTRVEGTGSTF